VTAHVDQLTRHGRRRAVYRGCDSLPGAAKCGNGQHTEHRKQQPPAGMAAQPTPRHGDHPHHEGKYRQWPYPAEDIQCPRVRCEDDEAGAKQAHEHGGHGCPSLRLVCPKRGEQRQQRPAKGEREQDRAGNDVQFLSDNLNKFLAAARKRPEIANVSTTFLPSVPQQFVDVDRDKVIKQGVAVKDVYQTLQAFMGGLFINYFNRFGRQWQVYVQAEGNYRTAALDAGQFYVRNNTGAMVPLSALTKFEPHLGPEYVMHYNEYPSAQINGSAAPGYSSDQAMAALEQVFAQTMPQGMGYDYMGMSFQQRLAEQGISSVTIFGISLLFVFLILAALYESWALPFSVLLSTPVAVFGAFGVLLLRRVFTQAFYPAYMVDMENDVYSQIGLVMVIGLAAKNAILIVEFAKDEYEKGSPLVDAALAGARLRLRPILMTSLAFVFGCVPLWFASGAGSVARRIMGTTVIGGMLAASAIGIFFIPAIFYFVEKLAGATRPDIVPATVGETCREQLT